MATPEEKALMTRFTGWGASEIANGVFPDQHGRFKPGWEALGERLKAALTEEEYANAQRSTQYAHYTSEGVIRSIFAGLERFGFKGGQIVEPGMGVGLFAGLMPDAIAAHSTYTGIEFDNITGAIAKHLYPQSNIIVGDFTRTNLPTNYFDAAIGNPPFSSTVISNDPEYKRHRFMLHDYFFAKTIDRVRPGGVVVFVTSKGTMDKASDKARKYLADRANLIGAVRLPQTAFKDNAGTEVVTDVLFLQKKGEGVEDNGVSWLGLKEVNTKGGEPTQVNEYFAAHPEMVLGEHSMTGSMYRANEYTVEPRAGEDIEQAFAKAVQSLPEGIYNPERGTKADKAKVIERDFNPTNRKEGGLYLSEDGTLMQVENGSGVPVTKRKSADGKKTIDLSAKQIGWLKDYVGLRDALKQAQYDQLNDGDWQASLKALNDVYDKFVKKHGQILSHTIIERENKDGTTSVTQRFKNQQLWEMDAEGALVFGIERTKPDGTVTKGPVFSERVLKRPTEPEIKTTQDALMVSLNRLGRLDIDDVAKLAGLPRDEAIDALGTAIYEDPSVGWQMADEYLSGNVVRKLEQARTAADLNKKYARNIDALLAVQPRPLGPTDITVRLGANWVPASDIADFAQEIMNERIDVTYQPITGEWTAVGHGSVAGSEWAAGNMSPSAVLDAVLNSRQLKVTYRDADGKPHTDPVATEQANDVARKMKEAFSRWVWTNPERSDRLTRYYNENFNNIAPRQYDGSHLTLPGVSLRFTLHPHQKRAVWRGIQDGDVYLAHAVGAGKTIEMIASGMEQRRLGLISKPIYTVPNHMLAQFSNEFLELYPTAYIMVADEQNFHTSNRRRFIAQASLNNPDAIVITHSAFGRIGMSDEFADAFVRRQIDEWQTALKDASDQITKKQIQRRIEELERRLEGKQSKEKKDQVLTFEELGADYIFVDEMHEFRKLDFATNQGNIKGIDPNGSQRALDLFMKVEYLRGKRPGRSITGASGTPITNTMGELFTVQRFFQPEQLVEDGLDTFDAWAAQYGDTVTGLEQDAAGGYVPVTRFAKFQNVPELMRRVRSFMDIVTNTKLGELVTRPNVKGGSRQIVVTPMPAGYKEYQAQLAARITAIKNRRGKPQKGDDIILTVINDGRFSSIDLRFVDPALLPDPDSKLNRMIDDMIDAYRATANNQYKSESDGSTDPNKGSTILVFSDIGLGEQAAKRRGFSMREWIEKRLTDAGIPREHIAFMRDYKQHAKKGRLFADMREGKKRLLIGGKDMETGVNVQKRLTHIFHLDAPWFPSSVEQREGRGVRQGNQNGEVDIRSYATKGSYDSTMWGMNARKARFIEQAMSGDDNIRSMEDVSEASAFELAAALASGDERYLKLAGLRGDVERLGRLRQAHHDGQNRMQRDRHWAESEIDRKTKLVKQYKDAIAKRVPIQAGEFEGKIGGKSFDSRDEFGVALFDAFKKLVSEQSEATKVIGHIGGFNIRFDGTRAGSDFFADVHVDVPGGDPILTFPIEDGMSVKGLATKAANQVNALDRRLTMAEQDIEASKRKIEQIDARFGAPFAEEAELMDKIAQLNDLETELAAESKEAESQQAPEQPKTEPPGDVAYSVLPVTETPAFKKWFGDSKVVDAEGKPMVVYHGTHGDFSAFRASQRDNTGTENEEFFFTESSSVASGYALMSTLGADIRALENQLDAVHDEMDAVEAAREAYWENKNWTDEQHDPWEYPKDDPGYEPEPDWSIKQESLRKREARIERQIERLEGKRDTTRGQIQGGESVYPVYLSMQNPLVVDAGAKGRGTADEIAIGLHSHLVEQAKKDGRDGVIVKNVHDSPVETDPHTVYIVFRPEQIKSATGNRGTFDSSNPDITYSVKADGEVISASARGTQLLQDQTPMSIRSTPALRDMKVPALRDLMFADLREANGLSHPDVGDISIGRRGWSKSRANASDPAKLLIIPSLPEIIRSGAYLGSTPAQGKSADIVGYHYIARRLNVDGVPVIALVTIEENSAGTLSYYNHTVLSDNFAAKSDGPADGLLASYRRPMFAPDGRMTRGQTLTAAHASVRDALRAGPLGALIDRLISGGHIVVHQSQLTLPASMRGKSALQGFTDKGIVNVAAENLTPQTAMPVLLHEAMHAKGEQLVGTKKWNALNKRLERLYKAAQVRKAEGRVRDGDYWDGALRRVNAAKDQGAISPAREVEEFGTYAIENYELAPSGIKKWVDDFIGMVKDWLYRRFGIQAGEVTPAQLRAMAIAALRSMDGTAPQFSRAMGGMAMNDGAMSAEDRYFVNEVLSELAANDEFFRHPRSTGYTLDRVTDDMGTGLTYIGAEPILESDQNDYNGAERQHRLRTAAGNPVRVFEDKNRVWLDVSRLDPGEGGSAVYAAIANYAYNTGKTFIGDPDGLSDEALYRRTEAMLNSALKFGTTRHLEPHPYQLEGNAELGVAPLKWQNGEDAENVRSMIDVVTQFVDSHVPDARDATFDFQSRTFRTGEGEPVTDGVLRGWVAPEKGGTFGIGGSSLKRSLLYKSLLRSASSERPGLLERVFRTHAELVAAGAPLNQISYSVSEREEALDEASAALAAADEPVGPALTDNLGSAIRDFYGLRGLWHRFITHPYTIAVLFPEFTPVFNAFEAQNRQRNLIMEDLYRDFADYQALSGDEKEGVNKVLELGRLTSNVYSDAELKAGIENPGYRNAVRIDEEGKAHRVRQDIKTGLTKAGDKINLNQKQIQAYKSVRKMFDRALQMFRDQMLQEFGLGRYAGQPKAAEAMMKQAAGLPKTSGERARLEEMAQFVADIEQASRTGYVPFTRYGDFFIAVKERQADIQYKRDGDDYLATEVPQALVEYLDSIGANYDNEADAWRLTEDQRKSLEKENEIAIYSEKVETGIKDIFGRNSVRRVKNEKRPVHNIPSVKKAFKRITAEYIDGHPGRRLVSGEVSKQRVEGDIDMQGLDALAELASIEKEVWGDIRERFGQVLQARGFRRHFIQSSNVPGYSTDFERSMAEYIVGSAGYLARRQHSEMWDKAVQGIKGEKLKAYATDYRQYVNDPSEEYSLIRQIGFFKYISGNLSSAFLNATQVPLLTMPFLTQITSYPQASAQVARAYKDALSILRPDRVGMHMFDLKSAPADVREDLIRAGQEGLLLPLQSLEVMGMANRRTPGGRRWQKGFDSTVQYAGIPFTGIERLNRVVTFIAAARLSKQPRTRAKIEQVFRANPMARSKLHNEDGSFSTYGFSEFAVDETQLVMGKGNRPTLMRSIGTPIFQFKSFTFQALEAMFMRFPMQGKEGRKARNLALITMMVLSGFWGLPGIDDLRDILEKSYKGLTGKDFDTRDWVRQKIYETTDSLWLARFFDMGLPAAGVTVGDTHIGVDMSRRIGMGNLLPGSEYETTGISAVDNYLLGSLGIPGDLIFGTTIRAGQQFLRGDVGGAVTQYMPNFVENARRSYEWHTKGVLTRAQRKMLNPEDVETSSIILKSIGFQPTQISELYAGQAAERRSQNAISQLRSNLKGNLVRALAAEMRNSDPEKVAELGHDVDKAFQAIIDHNESITRPEDEIKVTNSSIRQMMQRELGGVPAAFGREKKAARGTAQARRRAYDLERYLEPRPAD